jgi:serine/threonine protein kinase
VTEQALRIMPSGKRRVGRYTLLYHFATGGMANLYLARFTGPDGFEKKVAIKKIHDHLNKEQDFIRMFVDEARLAARISHPNVVQTLELGMEDDTHFIAMEYVNGENLTALVRRTKLPFSYSARVVADAAAGLHSAHELRDSDEQLLGVVHRDVSPQNILVAYDGAVKVVDFGVARARGGLHQTSVGTIKGKYSYMAPEQMRSEEVDRRTDIFSLGVVLFEVATRHRLFKGDSDAAVIEKVQRGPIARPTVLVPGFPPRLEEIILTALSRDPAGRFESSHALQEALEGFIIETGSPVLQPAIGKMMQKVFDDRIKRKKELLSLSKQVEDSVAHEDVSVPHIELGSNPSMTLDGRHASMAEAQIEALEQRDQRRGRKLAVLGVAVGVLVLVAGALLFLWISRDPEVATSKTPEVPAPTAPRVEATQLLPRTVRVSIKARPAGASISIDDKTFGNTYELRRPASDGALKVRVWAPGHLAQEFSVPLDEGGRWVIALEKKPIVAPALKVPVVGKRKPSGQPRRPARRYNDDDDDLFDSPYGK